MDFFSTNSQTYLMLLRPLLLLLVDHPHANGHGWLLQLLFELGAIHHVHHLAAAEPVGAASHNTTARDL